MTAETQGALRAPVHRFVLGEVEITAVLDGAIPMGISPPFLLDESDDEVASIAHAANLPTDRLKNNFVPVLVNTGDALVLMDTGCGLSHREAGAGFLRSRLAEAGYTSEDIDIVVLTQVHPDHIGGLWEDGDEIAKGVFAEAAFCHSSGHLVFRVKSCRKAPNWADVANHQVCSDGRPGSKVGFDDDKDVACRSVHATCQLGL